MPLFTLLVGSITITPEDIGLPNVSVDDAAIPNALSVTFTVIGAMTVLFVIIGAVQYIIANGEANTIQKAKFTILYAVIGLVLSLLAFTIVQFVARSIQ